MGKKSKAARKAKKGLPDPFSHLEPDPNWTGEGAIIVPFDLSYPYLVTEEERVQEQFDKDLNTILEDKDG